MRKRKLYTRTIPILILLLLACLYIRFTYIYPVNSGPVVNMDMVASERIEKSELIYSGKTYMYVSDYGVFYTELGEREGWPEAIINKY